MCTAARKVPWYPANVPGQELKVLPTLVSRPHSWNWSVIPTKDGASRIGQGLVREGAALLDLTMEERERAMGYEAGCTAGVSPSARHQNTGAAFDAVAVSTILATALALRLRDETVTHSSTDRAVRQPVPPAQSWGGDVCQNPLTQWGRTPELNSPMFLLKALTLSLTPPS